MLKLVPDLLSVFCSITVCIFGVEVQLGRVLGWRVLKPVLKSPVEPDAVGEVLAAQAISSLDDFVVSFSACLLDTHSGKVPITTQN